MIQVSPLAAYRPNAFLSSKKLSQKELNFLGDSKTTLTEYEKGDQAYLNKALGYAIRNKEGKMDYPYLMRLAVNSFQEGKKEQSTAVFGYLIKSLDSIKTEGISGSDQSLKNILIDSYDYLAMTLKEEGDIDGAINLYKPIMPFLRNSCSYDRSARLYTHLAELLETKGIVTPAESLRKKAKELNDMGKCRLFGFPGSENVTTLTKKLNAPLIKADLNISPQKATNDMEFNQLLQELKVGESLLVGRSPDCNYCINIPNISREHVLITRAKNGNLYLKDLNSSNGTKFNDSPIDPNSQPIQLNDTGTILLGGIKPIEIHKLALKSMPFDGQISKVEYMMGSSPVRFCNTITVKEGGTVTIGRADVNYGVLNLSDDRSLSAKHAILTQQDGSLSITDISRNGIRVNNTIIPKNTPVKLQFNDFVQLGNVIYRYDQGINGLTTFSEDANTFYEMFPMGLNMVPLKQGSVGDCYLLRTLTTLMENNRTKRYIANMIHKEENGNLLVRFFGARETISIDAAEVDKILHEPGYVDACKGLKIIERAYGRLRKKIQQSQDQTFMILNAGLTDEVIQNILPQVKLDHKSWSRPAPYQYSELEQRNHFEKAVELLEMASENSDNILITADTRADNNFIKKIFGLHLVESIDNVDIFRLHGYAIRSTDSKNKTVEIVNPHYVNPNNHDDSVHITYDQLFKFFRRIDLVDVSSLY